MLVICFSRVYRVERLEGIPGLTAFHSSPVVCILQSKFKLTTFQPTALFVIYTGIPESMVFSFDDLVSVLMCFYFISDFQDSEGHQARREYPGNPVLLALRGLQVMT